MTLYLAAYTLRNGTRGVLHVIGRNTCDVIVCTIDAFGEQLRTCSARPAAPRPPLHLQPHRS